MRVEVHVGAAATDAFREIVTAGRPIPNTSAVRGRGLHLVWALATRVGLDDDPDGGKVVWFEVDREAPASIRYGCVRRSKHRRCGWRAAQSVQHRMHRVLTGSGLTVIWRGRVVLVVAVFDEEQGCVVA